MRNEFIPIRNEFILDRNYGKLLRKALEWIHSRLEYIHSGSGFFIGRGTFLYSLTLGCLNAPNFWFYCELCTQKRQCHCVSTLLGYLTGGMSHWHMQPCNEEEQLAEQPFAYGAAFALFVETQHSRLYTTQAAWLTHPHIYTNQSQNFVDTSTKYYLLSTHFLCSQGSQDCVTWHWQCVWWLSWYTPPCHVTLSGVFRNTLRHPCHHLCVLVSGISGSCPSPSQGCICQCDMSPVRSQVAEPCGHTMALAFLLCNVHSRIKSLTGMNVFQSGMNSFQSFSQQFSIIYI